MGIYIHHKTRFVYKMEWLIQTISFGYAFYAVKPSEVVDKVIAFLVDVSVPGRGTGEDRWWMKGLRTIEQQAEKSSKELDIRSDLRRWDETYPNLHHELIVRYFTGFCASYVSQIVYDWFMIQLHRRDNHYRRR